MNQKLMNRIVKLVVLLLIVGLLPVYAQKKGKEKVNRLPDDLKTLAGDPALSKNSHRLSNRSAM